ncbi:helix-turn-helix domain-containing protein [Terasakiella sp.]|uniref:helix-turn-helix domain-containing protein n=1 Tax=Terasakiella sp. TaxID=2034861 RepID=UPI003AA93BA1
MKTIAERIKHARKQKGLSQTELGIACGVSKEAVYKWEKGKGYPSSGKYTTIANTLGISAEWLISGEETSKIDLIEDSVQILGKLTPENKRLANRLLQGVYKGQLEDE